MLNLASMICLVILNPPQDACWTEVESSDVLLEREWEPEPNDRFLSVRNILCYCDQFTLRGRRVAYSLQSFHRCLVDGETIVIVDCRASVDLSQEAYFGVVCNGQ